MDSIALNQKEISEIKLFSQQIGTYLKGLTGRQTHLIEEQWLMVRTTEFKQEYGDWENFYKSQYLLKAPVVSSLSGNEFSVVKGKTLTEQVAEYFDTVGGKVKSPFFGDVILDKKGADDSLAHGMGRLKAIAYAAVKDVIECGVLIDYDINHKERGYNSFIVVAPISIAKKRFVCCVVIRRNLLENKFYLHEVIKKEELLSEGSNTAQKQPQRLKVFAKILQNILSAKDLTIKCNLDENGESVIVE